MKLQNKLAIALGVAVLSSTASATLNFDLRHEIKDGNATKTGKVEHASRFKFGDTFNIDKNWKANLSLETKFKSDEATDFLKDVYINEFELDMGLTYKLGGGWELKPGMPVNVAYDEPNDNDGRYFYMKKVTMKPQLRVQHTMKLGSVKWKNALRYRYEIANYKSTEGGDSSYPCGDSSCKETVTNPNTSKITLTGALGFKQVKKLYLAWEANYVKSHDDVKKGLEIGDTTDWDLGIFVGYKIGNFRPYVEAWNIKNGGYGSTSGNKDPSASRGNKYRIGLKYYWK